MRRLFTSESVTEGHPDKLCDQVSDAILDEIIKQDPNAHVACECCATTGMLMIMGEITANAQVDYSSIARKKILEIGYNRAKYGFDGESCSVLVSLDSQSPDIAMGVNNALEGRNENAMETGAGDQGMMFGYACDETDEFMPMPIALAHRVTRRMAYVRKNGIVDYMRPDGKAQVTVEYESDKPLRVDAVVLSTQHDPDVNQETIARDMEKLVIRQVIPESLIDEKTKLYINPTGRFVVGGPQGDTGLTGRKIIVDTYGGMGRHGGGCFSGKDPTKVDRSAAYAARHAAKNIVAAGLAKRCEIQLSYAIGVAHPVSITVDTFGTGIISDDALSAKIGDIFDFRPAAIIERLDLRRPIYAQTAAYGHFGRSDLNLSWEKTDFVEALKKAL